MAMTVANKCLDAVTCNVISQTKLLFTAFFALQPLSLRKWASRKLGNASKSRIKGQ